MTFNISIEALVALVAAILGGFAWVVSRIDRIRDSLDAMRRDVVSEAICRERRKSCPCIMALRNTGDDFDDED